ncbi:MAG: hypothetical protein PVH37_08135, partial [Desulfobacterales bacterium]
VDDIQSLGFPELIPEIIQVQISAEVFAQSFDDQLDFGRMNRVGQIKKRGKDYRSYAGTNVLKTDALYPKTTILSRNFLTLEH